MIKCIYYDPISMALKQHSTFLALWKYSVVQTLYMICLVLNDINSIKDKRNLTKKCWVSETDMKEKQKQLQQSDYLSLFLINRLKRS